MRRSTRTYRGSHVSHRGIRPPARLRRYGITDALVDLAIFALFFVVAMMAGSLFVYGTWQR